MKIALDAMGGDNAPEVNIVGARDALALYPSIEILYLVGDKDILTKECAKHKLTDPRIEIVHATQVVAMHESGATTLRTKRDSSISVATGRSPVVVPEAEPAGAKGPACPAILRLSRLEV